jgi:hypothetical protein
LIVADRHHGFFLGDVPWREATAPDAGIAVNNTA